LVLLLLYYISIITLYKIKAAMKKILIILTIFIGCIFTIKANVPENKISFSYIITQHDTIFCEHLRVHGRTISYSVSGKKVDINKKDVNTYYKDGKRYDKLFLGKRKMFLELIKTRYNLKVYVMKVYIPQKGIIINKLFVYNGEGRFLTDINKRNKSTLYPFFNIREG
jgi:hypothetical protein